MTSCASYRSSKTDRWTSPRPHTDPSIRLQTYGPLVPMDSPSLWSRFKGFFS